MVKFLVVVDAQNDFISGPLGTLEANEIIPTVANYLHNIDLDTYVFFTKDIHNSNYLNTNEGKHLPVEHCIAHTDGASIHPALLEAFVLRPVTIEKNTFGSLELMEYIKDTLVLEKALENFSSPAEVEIGFCGLCTDICVIANAMLAKTFYPEATVVVYSDMCAGTTPRKHNEALSIMESCHIEIR